MVQNRPVGSSRTLIIALKGRLKFDVPGAFPVVVLPIEHAGDLINRFRTWSDGRKPRERNTGKKDSPLMAEFGESIAYLPMDRDRGQAAELDAKLFQGI